MCVSVCACSRPISAHIHTLVQEVKLMTLSFKGTGQEMNNRPPGNGEIL